MGSLDVFALWHRAGVQRVHDPHAMPKQQAPFRFQLTFVNKTTNKRPLTKSMPPLCFFFSSGWSCVSGHCQPGVERSTCILSTWIPWR